jgi:hypothetical protein
MRSEPRSEAPSTQCRPSGTPKRLQAWAGATPRDDRRAANGRADPDPTFRRPKRVWARLAAVPAPEEGAPACPPARALVSVLRSAGGRTARPRRTPAPLPGRESGPGLLLGDGLQPGVVTSSRNEASDRARARTRRGRPQPPGPPPAVPAEGARGTACSYCPVARCPRRETKRGAQPFRVEAVVPTALPKNRPRVRSSRRVKKNRKHAGRFGRQSDPGSVRIVARVRPHAGWREVSDAFA